MATLLDLVSAGTLQKLDAGLGGQQQEMRMLHAGPKLAAWITNDLPNLQSDWDIDQSPIEQLDDLLSAFCAGDPLALGWQFKSLAHIKDGVWQLKTQDLRVFGWFPQKDCFVGVVADMATRVKEYRLYTAYVNVEVIGFRDTLDLDEPKFLPGDDPNVVLTNYTVP